MADVPALLCDLMARWEDLRVLWDRVDGLIAAEVTPAGQTWSRHKEQLWRIRAHVEVAMAALDKARREAGPGG